MLPTQENLTKLKDLKNKWAEIKSKLISATIILDNHFKLTHVDKSDMISKRIINGYLKNDDLIVTYEILFEIAGGDDSLDGMFWYHMAMVGKLILKI